MSRLDLFHALPEITLPHEGGIRLRQKLPLCCATWDLGYPPTPPNRWPLPEGLTAGIMSYLSPIGESGHGVICDASSQVETG